MHSFKGLEFRSVAAIGVNAGALPFAKAVTPAGVDRLRHETDLMSERCLLFVACTRARDGITLSGCCIGDTKPVHPAPPPGSTVRPRRQSPRLPAP